MGHRPRGRRDLRHEAAYLFGAVCPERDTGVALVLPNVATTVTQLMLDELSGAVVPGAHALVIMEGAGWHCANELALPDNLTPIFLPPYSPELNAIERLWLYLRERFLSHRLWPTYDHNPRRLLPRLDHRPRRSRPDPLAMQLRLGKGRHLVWMV